MGELVDEQKALRSQQQRLGSDGIHTTTTATYNEWNSKLATWNVRTLARTGGLRMLAAELRKAGIEVTAIQAARWPGKDVFRCDDYAFYYSCGGKKEFSTGFEVLKKTLGAVIGFEAVDKSV